jgi:hypothetical protein
LRHLADATTTPRPANNERINSPWTHTDIHMYTYISGSYTQYISVPYTNVRTQGMHTHRHRYTWSARAYPSAYTCTHITHTHTHTHTHVSLTSYRQTMSGVMRCVASSRRMMIKADTTAERGKKGQKGALSELWGSRHICAQ